MGYNWDSEGELISVAFEADRLIKKEFTPLSLIERFRRTWTRTFGSKPPC